MQNSIPDDGAPMHCTHRECLEKDERPLAVSLLTHEELDSLKMFGFRLRAICEEHKAEAKRVLDTSSWEYTEGEE